MDADVIVTALGQAPAFLNLLSPTGTLLWSSRVAYGLDGDTITGRPADAVIFDEDRPAYWEAFRRAKHLRETVNVTIRVVVPEPPGFVRLAVRLAPVVARDRVKHLAVVSQDITAAPREVNPLAPYMLSPTSRRIVALLYPDRCFKAAKIARELGESNCRGQASSRLGTLLSNLRARGILFQTEDGYCLAPQFVPLVPSVVDGV